MYELSEDEDIDVVKIPDSSLTDINEGKTLAVTPEYPTKSSLGLKSPQLVELRGSYLKKKDSIQFPNAI